MMFPSIFLSVLFQAVATAHIENGHTKENHRSEDKGKIRHQFLHPGIYSLLPLASGEQFVKKP
jgi:hypothetical protein